MDRDLELDRWHGRSVDHWQRLWGVPSLRIFRRVASTNDVAARLAAAGAPQGAVVLADEQTAGRGQRGRAWRAPQGASLSFSMVIRPATPGSARLLTLRLGLAAAEAVEATHPVRVGIKWPNDLVVDDRKLAGILCESDLHGDAVRHVVAGIGVNLAQRDDDWPAELRGRATSLAAAGATPDPPGLAGRLARGWLASADRVGARLSDSERAALGRRDRLQGRVVTVDGATAGTADGITADGALRVTGADGPRRIVAGTIRTQPEGIET